MQPEVAYVLMLIGIYGLLFELMSPGHILPGLVGAVALGMVLYALALLPVDYAGMALALLGIALMAAEPFVLAHGIIGAAGAVAFAFGSLMMFSGAATLSPWLVAGATAGSAVMLVWALGVAARARRRPATSGTEAMIGTTAEVVDWSGDRGRVHVHGEDWEARAAAPLRPGQRVVVRRRDGLVLFVDPQSGGG